MDGPRVIPFINYEDGVAALDWLARAFGFRERTRMLDGEGRLAHGELELDGGLIMLASTPGYVSPNRLASLSEPWRQALDNPYVIDGTLVYVDDIDGHFERAKAAGARILSPVEDSEHGRRYRVADLEGHRWMFMQAP
jgi:uncharacterized glyoxalase superfamily protein PhnB